MASADPFGTKPLFEEVPATPVAPILTDTSGGHGKVTYVRYRVKAPVRCDDCAVAFVHDRGAPHSRTAAFKRTQAGTEPLLLCYEHVRLRKEKEAQ